jgi:hypothetical protein
VGAVDFCFAGVDPVEITLTIDCSLGFRNWYGEADIELCNGNFGHVELHIQCLGGTGGSEVGDVSGCNRRSPDDECLPVCDDTANPGSATGTLSIVRLSVYDDMDALIWEVTDVPAYCGFNATAGDFIVASCDPLYGEWWVTLIDTSSASCDWSLVVTE